MQSLPQGSDSDPETMLIMPLTPPAMFDDFDAQLLACAIRNNVRPFSNAPHGYYIDEETNEPFAFYDGDDVEVARSKFRALRRGQVVSVLADNQGIQDAKTPTGAVAISQARHTVGRRPPVDNSSFAPLPYVQPVMAPEPSSGMPPAPPAVPIMERDNQSLLPFSYPTGPGLASLYTIMINFAVPGNIGLNTRDFVLAIDSAETRVWFYGENFRRISTNWIKSPTEEWPPKTVVDRPPWDSRVTVPRPSGSTLAYDDTSAPQAALGEEAVRYLDNSAVFLRHHHGPLPAWVPCWDWELNQKGRFPLHLPYTIAYAANDRMVLAPYDGLLGLGVYDAGPHHRSIAARLTLEGKAWRPSMFTIRLTHPDMKIWQRVGSSNYGLSPFVCFGPYAPCTETTPLLWTPRIYVRQGAGVAYTTWRVELESMDLLVPQAGVNPRYDSEDGFEVLKIVTNFPVVLDTGSTCSMFPTHVVDQIKEKWLKNKPGNRLRRPYCGPERNLKDCDIVFTFISGSERVKFRCGAARFLATPWNFSHFGEHESAMFSPRDSYKECAIASVESIPRTDATPTQTRRDFSLGMGIFWSAFVFHFSDPYAKDPPYIRLAAERALDKAGKPAVLTEHYFKLKKGRPARYNQRLDE